MLATICYMNARVTLDIDAIGDRASARREELHLEQEEVAEKAGMSRAYISRLENGGVRNPKVVDLAAVAAALGLSLDRLIYGHASGDADADLSSLLTSMLDPEVGSLMAKTARKYPEMTPDQRGFLIYALRHV